LSLVLPVLIGSLLACGGSELFCAWSCSVGSLLAPSTALWALIA